MVRFIKKADDIVSRICAGLSFCGAVIIFLVMIVVVLDVGGRLLFNHPLTGAVEIIRMVIPIIAFFMLPWATHEFRHVRSTVIYDRVPARGKIAIDVIVYLLAAILFALMVKASWPELMTAIRIGEFEGEGALRISTTPTRALIIISSALMVWEWIRCVVITIGQKGQQNEVYQGK